LPVLYFICEGGKKKYLLRKLHKKRNPGQTGVFYVILFL
jgi:hypothetical protein